jgi:cytochrome c biogenesis protein CcmG/thiol:disulfide interchange protein DsbE
VGVAIGSLDRRDAAPGRTQTIIVIVVVLLAIGGMTWFVTNGFDDGVTSVSLAGPGGGVGPSVGSEPAAFTGLSYSGNPISLADYAGKPLWLTFGASWCRDCRVEAADLEATYAANRAKGLNVLAVFINDPPADIGAYVKRAGLTFPIIADQGATIGGAYRLMGIPTHIFIGADGLVREIRIGALSKNEMEQAVESILR